MYLNTLFVIAIFCVSLSSALKWRQLDAHEKHQYKFEHFKAEFGRVYKDRSEESMRRQLFEKNLRKIHRHNADKSKTWRMGVNKLTDRTESELKALRGVNGALLHKQKVQRKLSQVFHASSFHYDPNFNLSLFADVNVDWRTKGVVTDPKDQAQCGSCWTFSTAETIESFYAIKTGNLTVLSEQQILDCTPNPNGCGGTGGCEGGTVELAAARIIAMGGLTQESDYPYRSGGGQDFKCDLTQFKPAVKIAAYHDLPSNQLSPVLQFVAKKGPLSISVDASAWNAYESGVFDGCNNQNPDIDHAVQLVGFGTDANGGGDYWLVRNSWGPDYGEQGYIRLKRYADTPCGVDSNPSDGDGCTGGPAQVKVCGNCAILYDTVFVDVA